MKWYRTNIYSKQDILNFIKDFKETKPTYTSFDTETNGLHIRLNKPFLLAFGFVNIETKIGKTYTLDFEKHPELMDDTIFAIETLFNTVKKNVAWNTKFDLHMLANMGYDNLFGSNLTDAMIYVRLAHDALPKSTGAPMSLKGYATKYIDPNARYMQREIKAEQKKMKQKRNLELKRRLSGYKVPEEYKVSGKEREWTIGMLNNFFKDKISEVSDLPKEIQPIVKRWLEDTPDPDNYQNINRATVTKYAHYDIIYTLEAFIKLYPEAYRRKQSKTIKREEQLIKPLYRMERVGFKFNLPYALESKQRMKAYIIRRRKTLQELAGKHLKTNQHEELKKVLRNKYHLNLDSTGQEVLKALDLKERPQAKELVDVVTELRTLEKWYSTYILKWLDNIYERRVYTTINQAGTVSGRVSSDFQQFPKGDIKDLNGNSLFNPRRMIKVSGNGYNSILLLDYSQIELRFQAIYTLLVAEGDLNLCRAYMPFKCKNAAGVEFDYKNTDHLKRWNTEDWFLNEDPKTKWTKVDLHSATTKTIFPELEEGTPEFKKARYIGKTTNFACNYGAQPKTLGDTLNAPELGQRAFDGYYKTFPKVREYQDYVAKHIYEYGYAVNLFGRRYYNASPHNAQNYLVQGSAADFLKDKIIEVDKFLSEGNYKTRFQMNIHDELSFEVHKDDPKDLPDKLKEVMETLDGTLVPIVADKEITNTTWDEKVEL